MPVWNVVDVFKRKKEYRFQIRIHSFYLPTLFIKRRIPDTQILHYPPGKIIFFNRHNASSSWIYIYNWDCACLFEDGIVDIFRVISAVKKSVFALRYRISQVFEMQRIMFFGRRKRIIQN